VISYSTNMMGPVSLHWYRERGLLNQSDEVTEYWAGGRIDIYGVPGEHYPIEYALPIMDGTSWNLFSDWLDEYETIELKTYDQLLSAFEADTDHVIRWAHEEFIDYV